MIESEEAIIYLNKEQYSVYRCMCYFDIFSHPLKAEEIGEFIDVKVNKNTIRTILEDLINLGLVFAFKGHYSLTQENEGRIKKRYNSEKRFFLRQKTIKRFASLIARFPYVEAVCISGSCSKGLLEEKGDVDYFVITSPQKLWLCRTLLIAFKKIFLLNSKKYFCLNYFVDSNTLEIPDRNIFVANEIKTLIPVSNKPLFEKFLKANEWADAFLPNKVGYNQSFLMERKPRKYFFRLIEFLLANKLGDKLETWCYTITFSTWKKRFSQLNTDEFNLNFRSKRNVSKHHPRGFQNKVLFEMEKKLHKVKVQHGL